MRKARHLELKILVVSHQAKMWKLPEGCFFSGLFFLSISSLVMHHKADEKVDGSLRHD